MEKRFPINSLSCALSCLLLSSATVNAQDNAICAAPLRDALMTVRVASTTGSSTAAYDAWQCSFKFATHDDAIKSGLQVGAVVHGVPLQIGGTFDQNRVKTWKEENCSKSSMNESFANATYNYLREVAPGAMRAFSDCVAATMTTSAVACSLTRSPEVLTVRWRRMSGELPEAAPKVTRVTVTNGTCEPVLKPGTVIQDGGTGATCKANSKQDLLVQIQTSRGVCNASAPYPKQVFTLAGTTSLQADRQIVADVVEIADGARVVMNGRSLSIRADEVQLKGKATIVSFERETAPRPPGEAGISGGAFVLDAKRLNGGDTLTIDLSGQPGVQGKAGERGSRGLSGRNATGRFPVNAQGCVGGQSSRPGSQGGQGGPGGPGGIGGNGGSVIIKLEDPGGIARLNVIGRDGATLGGPGGAPGAKGPGGPGGAGGRPGTPSGGCGGRGGSPDGPPGHEGPAGAPGANGKPGVITLVTTS
jgi:hypothetical protein